MFCVYGGLEAFCLWILLKECVSKKEEGPHENDIPGWWEGLQALRALACMEINTWIQIRVASSILCKSPVWFEWICVCLRTLKFPQALTCSLHRAQDVSHRQERIRALLPPTQPQHQGGYSQHSTKSRLEHTGGLLASQRWSTGNIFECVSHNNLGYVDLASRGVHFARFRLWLARCFQLHLRFSQNNQVRNLLTHALNAHCSCLM